MLRFVIVIYLQLMEASTQLAKSDSKEQSDTRQRIVAENILELTILKVVYNFKYFKHVRKLETGTFVI